MEFSESACIIRWYVYASPLKHIRLYIYLQNKTHCASYRFYVLRIYDRYWHYNAPLMPQL